MSSWGGGKGANNKDQGISEDLQKKKRKKTLSANTSCVSMKQHQLQDVTIQVCRKPHTCGRPEQLRTSHPHSGMPCKAPPAPHPTCGNQQTPRRDPLPAWLTVHKEDVWWLLRRQDSSKSCRLVGAAEPGDALRVSIKLVNAHLADICMRDNLIESHFF